MTHATSDGQRSCPASSLKATPHGGTTVLTVLTTLPGLPSLGPAPVNNVKVDNSGMQPPPWSVVSSKQRVSNRVFLLSESS